MTEDFRRLREAILVAQRRRQPDLTRIAFQRAKDNIDVLDRIDEVIQVPYKNERYGEPRIFEEADSDGRWILYVAEVHERRQFLAARAGRPRPSISPRPVGRQSRPCLSTNDQGGPSYVDDRNKENKRAPQYFSDPSNSSAIESDSSDDEDMEMNGAADDAERERISQLFEDFPTCIQKSRNAHDTNNSEYGIMAISNAGSRWTHIDRAKLPPRIVKYLTGFTHREAAAFPDSASSDLAAKGIEPHRWLLATARREFICDTTTLNVWYRPLADAQQTAPSQQPL